MKRSGPPLLDLHDLGQRQTGNETWARGISRALFELDGRGSYDIAVTPNVTSADLDLLPARRQINVSRLSSRRLAWDLPHALRQGRNSALLVQYTVPITSTPAIVAVHDLSFEDPAAVEWLPTRTRLRYKATIRTSVNRAEHVLCLSEATRNNLVQHYGTDPGQITIVPPSIDPQLQELLEPSSRQYVEPFVILAVGNVLPRKNLVVLARGVRRLRERGMDVRLSVVGMVPAGGRHIASAMSRALGDHLAFAGYVTIERLAHAYNTAHVLAFPSLHEGFGIPVLEAMWAGLPVVVSDRGALPEVVGDAGLVVPAEDSLAWADAIEAVLTTSRRAELSRRGASRARLFTWSRAAAQVSDLMVHVRSSS